MGREGKATHNTGRGGGEWKSICGVRKRKRKREGIRGRLRRGKKKKKEKKVDVYVGEGRENRTTRLEGEEREKLMKGEE